MKKDLPQDPDLQVRLKPIFGIKPGIYLLALYTFAFCLAAYWLFLEPGLHRPGSLVNFRSTPSGAGVFTQDSSGNERYWGATPVSAFLPEGTYSLELRKENFQGEKTPLTVGNRLFFSRFLPETLTVEKTLTGGDLEGIKASFDRELSQWAVLGPSMGEYAYPSLFSATRPKENWVGVSHPLPPLFSQLKDDWVASGGQDSDLTGFLGERLHWVSDPYLYRDLLQSLGLPGEGYPFSTQLSFWKEKLPGVQGWASWILVNQPYKDRNALSQTPAFRQAWEQEKTALPQARVSEGAPLPRALAGMSFLGVPGGVYTFGNPGNLSIDPPFQGGRAVEISPFLLGRTEVTNGDFARFIQAVKKWSPANRPQLEAEGLADQGYLADWTSDQPPVGRESYPVTGVSWYAAQAFAAWVEAQTPGYSIALPLEEEWEWAARDGGQNPDWSGENLYRNLRSSEIGSTSLFGFRGLSGQVWEWTASDAAQTASLIGVGSKPHTPLQNSVNKTLRGGSYADPKTLHWSERGFYAARWCTPFAGFRLLARPK